jgi:hypothetical protein
MSILEENRASGLAIDSVLTDAQREAIRAEADQILADPAFKNSKRCVALFRRLIDHALDGDLEGVAAAGVHY